MLKTRWMLIGVGATAVTTPGALAGSDFWKGLAGSTAGGAIGAVVAGVARGTPFGRLALALPVVGGMLGFDAATGSETDWERIVAQVCGAVLISALLPASTPILVATAVMIAGGYVMVWIYDGAKRERAARVGHGEPSGSGQLALIGVASGQAR